jgi:hypothetical protein
VENNIQHLPSGIHVSSTPLGRHAWLGQVGAAGLVFAGCARRPQAGPPDPATPIRFPQKFALRALNDRAPLLETPWHYFGLPAQDIEVLPVGTVNPLVNLLGVRCASKRH